MGAAKLPSLTVYDVSTRAPIRNEQAVAGKIGCNWVYFWGPAMPMSPTHRPVLPCPWLMPP
jgi:hypothetical protein